MCVEDMKMVLCKTQSFSDTCRALEVGSAFLIPGKPLEIESLLC